MKFSKLTSKHQATIPKNIREKLSLVSGDYVQFDEQNGQVVVTKVERLDRDYLEAVGMTLESEWLSEADEAAYADL
jgi:antitoxin PrlF